MRSNEDHRRGPSAGDFEISVEQLRLVAHSIYQVYLGVVNYVFQASIPTIVQIPQTSEIDFRDAADRLQALIREVERLSVDEGYIENSSEPELARLLGTFLSRLLAAVESLRKLCERLEDKTVGKRFTLSEYRARTAEYQELAESLEQSGAKLNRWLLEHYGTLTTKTDVLKGYKEFRRESTDA